MSCNALGTFFFATKKFWAYFTILIGGSQALGLCNQLFNARRLEGYHLHIICAGNIYLNEYNLLFITIKVLRDVIRTSITKDTSSSSVVRINTSCNYYLCVYKRLVNMFQQILLTLHMGGGCYLL